MYYSGAYGCPLLLPFGLHTIDYTAANEQMKKNGGQRDEKRETNRSEFGKQMGENAGAAA
jgi:phosphotransferase system  glucose/maltose/N-acetylglucosamine-specific IIC component